MGLLRRRWGEALFLIVGAAAILRAGLIERVHGHFQMGWESGFALWSASPVYDVARLGNFYFYSPACGMFLYAPFGLLPEHWNVAAFLTASFAILYFGMKKWSAPHLSGKGLQLWWFFLIPHLYSSLAAHKTEIASCGLFFWAMHLLRRAPWVSGALVGMVANWKLQPLPAAALVGIVLVAFRCDRRWIASTATSFAFWTITPSFVHGWEWNARIHREWLASVSRYSAESFDFYDNLFAFFGNNWALKVSYAGSQWITLALGAALGAALAIWAWRHRRESARLDEGLLLATGLGFAYTVHFSPLQQINAYLLIAPLLLAVFFYRDRAGGSMRAGERAVWNIALVGAYLILTFAYSELVPQPLRDSVRHAVVRAPTVFALTLMVLARALGNEVPKAAPRA